MNPITALSDLLSKLVIERGSAVIQEKQIALLNTQFTILARENDELKSKNHILETENQNLKQENKYLKLENDKLKQKIREHDEGGSGFASGVLIT